eukprot:c20831_g1_i1.p2 GENE.c20831_g1_i1~~c20831_g1_i1.p2  ORF type:complete len:555 (-),score=82.41 c20831_g1_i1:163-1827(-)
MARRWGLRRNVLVLGMVGATMLALLISMAAFSLDWKSAPSRTIVTAANLESAMKSVISSAAEETMTSLHALQNASLFDSPVGHVFLEWLLENPGERAEMMTLMVLNGLKVPALWYDRTRRVFVYRDADPPVRRTVTPWDEAPLSAVYWPRSVPATVPTDMEGWLKSDIAGSFRGETPSNRSVSLLATSPSYAGHWLKHAEYTGNTKHVMFSLALRSDGSAHVENETSTAGIWRVVAKCKPSTVNTIAAKASGPVRQDQMAHYETYMGYVYGLGRLVTECGFEALTPRVWVDSLEVEVQNGTEQRYRFRYDAAFFSERFPIAAQSLQRLVDSGLNVTGLVNRIPDWQIRLMVLHDVLFVFKDRHYANILVDPWGNIYNLDATQVTLAQPMWNGGPIDSIMLPTTMAHTIQRLGFPYTVQNKPNIRAEPTPIQFLDYRCVSKGGVLGFDYPPAMQKCMTRLSSMKVADVVAEYRLPTASAEMLIEQATKLLTVGFERTLYDIGQRTMARKPIVVKRWSDGCCSIARSKCVPSNFTNWDDAFGGPGIRKLGDDTRPG